MSTRSVTPDERVGLGDQQRSGQHQLELIEIHFFLARVKKLMDVDAQVKILQK